MPGREDAAPNEVRRAEAARPTSPGAVPGPGPPGPITGQPQCSQPDAQRMPSAEPPHEMHVFAALSLAGPA